MCLGYEIFTHLTNLSLEQASFSLKKEVLCLFQVLLTTDIVTETTVCTANSQRSNYILLLNSNTPKTLWILTGKSLLHLFHYGD